MYLFRVLLVAFTLLATLAPALSAQGGSNEKARRAEARRLMAEFEDAVAKLPKPPKIGRRELPDPHFESMDLGRRIQKFLQRYADLPFTARAWKMLALSQISAGDVAGAISTYRDAAQASKIAAIGDRHLEAAIALETDWGGYQAAMSILETLEKAAKNERLKTDYATRRQVLQMKTAPLDREIRKLMPDLSPKTGTAGVRAMRQADRFVRRWPRHASTPTLLSGMLKSLAKLSPAERQPQLDWLAFYHPKTKNGQGAMSKLLAPLSQEGFYERALLYAQRLQSPKVARQLSILLRQIASRDLGLDHNTKKKRVFDLQRRGNRRMEALETLDVARDFGRDYPRCQERRQVLYAAAKSAANDAPDEALTILESLLKSKEPWPQREEALTIAMKIRSDADGEEAAIVLLDGQLGQLQDDPGLRTRLVFKKAELLSKLDRDEDALETLQAALGSTKDPEHKKQLQKAIKDLESRIAGD